MAPLGYTDSADIGPSTLICGWLFTAIALLCVVSLIWCKIHTRRGFEIDDLLIIVATVVHVVLTAQITWSIVDEGQGKHAQDESSVQLVLVVKVRDSSPLLQRRR